MFKLIGMAVVALGIFFAVVASGGGDKVKKSVDAIESKGGWELVEPVVARARKFIHKITAE